MRTDKTVFPGHKIKAESAIRIRSVQEMELQRAVGALMSLYSEREAQKSARKWGEREVDAESYSWAPAEIPAFVEIQRNKVLFKPGRFTQLDNAYFDRFDRHAEYCRSVLGDEVLEDHFDSVSDRDDMKRMLVLKSVVEDHFLPYFMEYCKTKKITPEGIHFDRNQFLHALNNLMLNEHEELTKLAEENATPTLLDMPLFGLSASGQVLDVEPAEFLKHM